MLLHLMNVVPQRLHDVDLAGRWVPDVLDVVANQPERRKHPCSDGYFDSRLKSPVPLREGSWLGPTFCSQLAAGVAARAVPAGVTTGPLTRLDHQMPIAVEVGVVAGGVVLQLVVTPAGSPHVGQPNRRVRRRSGAAVELVVERDAQAVRGRRR